MGGRSGTTFAKLQKERSRREKQAEKEQRRRQRALDKKAGIVSTDSDVDEDGIEIAQDGPEAALQPDSEGNL
jgi:hypothetical protein